MTKVIELEDYLNPELDEYVFTLGVGFVENIGRNKKPKKHAMIMLKNINSGISIVHPLTSFIFSKWKYKDYNSQRLQSTHLIPFLNYVLITNRHQFKLLSLSELKFEHGTKFLNDLLSKNRSRDHVRNIERTLVSFYEFIAKKDCPKFYSIRDFIRRPIPSKPSKSYIVSPFKAYYSSADDENQELIQHDLKVRFLFPFLRTAVRVARPVALAIYFAIFGGLRAGEVVNIRHRDISTFYDEWGSGGIKLLISSQELRTDILDASGTSQAKRPRKQFVFNVKELLPILYQAHMEYLSKFYGGERPPLSHALFINRDGQPLTGKSLRYYFGVVKEAFLAELEMSDNPDDVIEALNLRATKWSFHIGRGIFTNLVSRLAKNPYEIALARGDMSIFSALTYMADSESLKREIETLIGEVFNSDYD